MRQQFAVLIVFFSLICGTLLANEPHPNILVILSDDQGYADAGFQGSKEVPTPNLDKLAQEGVRCTQGYVTASYCSASRAGLLTGRFQARFGYEQNPPDPVEGLPLTERTLPQFLKNAGYQTAWIGKWHLGSGSEYDPAKRGFDETFGFFSGGHFFQGWQPGDRHNIAALTRNGRLTDEVPTHLTSAFAEEASGFIKRNKENPWFLYLTFNAPHVPHQPTTEWETRFAHIEPEQRRKYVAQIAQLDEAIGGVLKTLSDSGQTDRTLVFFFSDNGGSAKQPAINLPLRGAKGNEYEGGIRVPFLVRFPGKIPAGTTYEQPVSSVDVFGTSLALAGVPIPTNTKYDSVNLIPYLNGEKKGSPHEKLFWRQGKNHVVREGNWKLIQNGEEPIELYNLSNDIGESSNLAMEHREIAEQLKQSLNVWKSEIIAPLPPGEGTKQKNREEAARQAAARQKTNENVQPPSNKK